MTKTRPRGETIRKFILDNIEKYPSNINKITVNKFGITRQAANKHLQKLTAEHALIVHGMTKNRTYKLAPLSVWEKNYTISSALAEDLIWRNDIRGALGQMPDNVLDIWQHGFTEMFNNAIDHSEGKSISVKITKTAINTEMIIFDGGIGIFKKIQTTLNSLDERHAILELSKGKLTTDPKHHSGEGIFFTSRMFDSYDILSGEIYFSHQLDCAEDWLMERDHGGHGTFVWMKLDNHTARTSKKIFDQYTSGEDYSFNKTVVQVKLAKYDSEELISRSQAKRLLARTESFTIVVFDFSNVDAIGQAFADEIFRVFAHQHPGMRLEYIHANAAVRQMISRAKSR